MIEIKFSGIDQARRAYGDKVVLRAMVSAINKTARQVDTAVRKAIRETYNIKAKDLSKARILRKARFSNPRASVSAKGGRIPLSSFAARQVKKGATVRIKKKEPRKLIKGAFVAQVGGHRGVFWRGRPGDGRRRRKSVPRREKRDNIWGSTQLPIDELTTLSIPKMFEAEGLDVGIDTANEKYPPIFEHELRFYVNRALGRV